MEFDIYSININSINGKNPGEMLGSAIWVCLKMLCSPKPNGFADHSPYEKWLFHWEYTLFADKPIHSINVNGNNHHPN